MFLSQTEMIMRINRYSMLITIQLSCSYTRTASIASISFIHLAHYSTLLNFNRDFFFSFGSPIQKEKSRAIQIEIRAHILFHLIIIFSLLSIWKQKMLLLWPIIFTCHRKPNKQKRMKKKIDFVWTNILCRKWMGRRNRPNEISK